MAKSGLFNRFCNACRLKQTRYAAVFPADKPRLMCLYLMNIQPPTPILFGPEVKLMYERDETAIFRVTLGTQETF